MKTIFAVAAVAVASFAVADTQYIDFENYGLGPITNGYNGWQVTNPAWDQEVVGVDALAGNQSWHISNAVASGSFGDQPFTPALTNAVSAGTAYDRFEASWMWAGMSNAQLGEGITVSIDNGTGQRGNYIRLECENTNLSTWRIYVFDYDGTTFVSTNLMNNIQADEIVNISFDMQFNTGSLNDVWNVYLNNTLSYTGIGWEGYFEDVPEVVTPYDRLLFRAGGVATANAAGILVDNISYSSVPEPTTMALAGIALAGFIARKRKKA